MELKDRIRKLYRENSKTIEEFANSINVSPYTVDKWLAGTTHPRKKALLKISEVYKVTIEWLEYGIENQNDHASAYKIRSKKIKDFMMNLNLAEKDNEIDHLKEKLKLKDQEISLLKKEIEYLKNQLNTNSKS